MDNEILQEILSEIKGIKTDVKGINTEISEIKTEISGIKTEVQNLNNRMDTVEGKLDEQRDILRALEHRTEENSAQLTSLSENVNYIKGDIIKINSRLDYQVAEIAKTKEEVSILQAVK